MDSSSNANKQQTAATGYQQQAAQGYQGLQQAGNAALGSVGGTGGTELNQLLSQLGNIYGISVPSPFGNSSPTGQQNANQATGNALTNQAQLGRTNAQGQFNQLAKQGQTNLNTFNQGFGGALNAYDAAAQIGGGTPFALNQNQQAELNGQVSTIRQQGRTAVSEYQSQMEAAGITGPALAEGAQMIQAHYDTQASQFTSAYTENARQQQVTNAANLMNTLLNVGAQGAQETSQAAQGTAGVAGQTEQAGETAKSQGMQQQQMTQQAIQAIMQVLLGQQDVGLQALGQGAGGIAGLGGAAQNASLQYGQQSAADISSLLGVLTLGLGGGNKGGGGGSNVSGNATNGYNLGGMVG